MLKLFTAVYLAMQGVIGTSAHSATSNLALRSAHADKEKSYNSSISSESERSTNSEDHIVHQVSLKSSQSVSYCTKMPMSYTHPSLRWFLYLINVYQSVPNQLFLWTDISKSFSIKTLGALIRNHRKKVYIALFLFQTPAVMDMSYFCLYRRIL